MRVSLKFSALFLSSLALLAGGGCASNPDALAPGTPREQVLRSYGKPTADITLPTGERLQYSRQPFGQQVYNIDLDANGKVIAAEQALNQARFATVQPDVWTDADVVRTFGKPAIVSEVYSFKGIVWSYRFYLNSSNMEFHVFLDSSGMVRRTQTTLEMVGKHSMRF